MVMRRLGTAKAPAMRQRRRHWATVAACRSRSDCTPAAASVAPSACSPSKRRRCCCTVSLWCACAGCCCCSCAGARFCSSAPKPTISTATTSNATHASSRVHVGEMVTVAVSVLRFTDASATHSCACSVLATVATQAAHVIPSIASTTCPPLAADAPPDLLENTVAPKPMTSTAAQRASFEGSMGPDSTSPPT